MPETMIALTRAIGMPMRFVEQLIPLDEIEQHYAPGDNGVVTGLVAKVRELQATLAEREAEVKKIRERDFVLKCDGCGRLYVDDHDALDESCETPGCGRFKQRMEWATPQEIEDADTKLRSENAQLRERVGVLEGKHG